MPIVLPPPRNKQLQDAERLRKLRGETSFLKLRAGDLNESAVGDVAVGRSTSSTGVALAELTDVELTGLGDQDVLLYEAASGLWKNESYSVPAGGTDIIQVQVFS